MAYQTALLRHSARLAFAVTALAGITTTALGGEGHASYNLAPGASSKPIALPAVNAPVSVTGVQTAVGYRAVGQATMLRVSPAQFLEWVGIDYFTAAISRGFSATPGTHIIWLDYSGQVDIQVSDANHIIVHNAAGGMRTGLLTFVW